MTITFLGTGTSQGVPVIACECRVCRSTDPRDNRFRTSVMVETQGKTFVVDAGPDFRQQMLREKVKRIDAILFTHEHKDHTAGLDDVRGFNYFNKKAMEVYATPEVEKALKKSYDYIFENARYPGVPKVNLHGFENKPFTIEGVPIMPVRVMHYKMPVYGFRFGDFTYITDANYIAPEELDKIKNSKALVLNALRREPHISHYSLKEAVDLIGQVQPSQAYLTHISHQMGLYREVEAELPDHVHLAYDGLKITI